MAHSFPLSRVRHLRLRVQLTDHQVLIIDSPFLLPITHHNPTTMEALVHRLAPPPAYVNPDDVENGDASWGNLNELGVVKGMQIPRVPDVGSFALPHSLSC